MAPALEVERARGGARRRPRRRRRGDARGGRARARADDDAAALEACFFAADALLAAEDDARAEACFTRVAGTDGALADDALYRLGFAHLARADAEPARLAQAAQAFAELARRFPRSELVGEALWLARASARGAPATPPPRSPARERVRREHRGHDARPKALFRLGQCALATGDAARAVDALQELLGSAPDFEAAVEARLVLGRALAAQGQARGARAAFDAVLAADQGVFAARARLELGRLELAAGRHEDALSHFLKVALLYAYDDEVAEATLLAGRCLEAQGERALARDQYERVVREHADTRHAAAARERLAALRTE
ncbi:MAG: tetratricopeptide repeat protein [Planctomycetes bacterium]|nr:tetratricopeptide repeat protein [Planctomycetota bacterium]